MINYPHQPNRPAVVEHAPASTDWTAVTIPSGVPVKGVNVSVTIVVTDSSGVANGSTCLIAHDSAAAPTTGVPILPGVVHQTTFNYKLWLKLGAGTDKVYLQFFY